jgi:hypothetical protein
MSRKAKLRRLFEHGGKPESVERSAQNAKPEEKGDVWLPGTGQPCHVANQGCTHPAGWKAGNGHAENKDANAEFLCSECDEPVCGACSGISESGRRVCSDCRQTGGDYRRRG